MAPYPQGAPFGSIGVPLPDTDAKIVDLNAGENECNAGETGELVVKGPQIMRGYWNNREMTAAALRDGWLYTGDLARMSSDGFFFLVDRKDDLIISSGFNVYPSQIEEVLKKHPKVKDAAALGIPDRVKGQSVLAVIVLNEGAEGEKGEFLSYCRENMPEYRVPKSIYFRKDIPKDPAGKVLKRILRQEASGL
jgi:long-chain acyl-CoA synthetase